MSRDFAFCSLPKARRSDARRPLLCILLGFAVGSGFGNVQTTQKPPPTGSPACLVPGAWVSGTLSGGSGATHCIPLQAGQCAKLLFAQHGSRTVLSLLGPGGDRLRELQIPDRGGRSVSICAGASGEYILEARSRLPSGYSNIYSLQWIDSKIGADRYGAIRLAEDRLAEGDVLRLEGRGISSREALEKYREAAGLFLALGEHEAEAAAHVGAAEVYFFLGRLEEASQGYRHALTISEKAGHNPTVIAALNGLSAIGTLSGEREAVLANSERALKLSRDTKDRLGEADTLQVLGTCFGWSSDYDQSTGYYRQSLSIRNELHDYRGQGQTILWLGYNASDSNDLAASMQLYERALALFRAVDDRRSIAEVTSAIIWTYCQTGRYWDAMSLYGEAEKLFASLDQAEVSARMFNTMGYVYLQMGMIDISLRHFRQALALYERSRHEPGTANTLNLIGRALMASGKPAEARPQQQRALLLFRQIRDPRMEAITLRYLGDVHAAGGRIRDALELYDEAVRISRLCKDKRAEAFIQTAVGRCHEANGRAEESLAAYAAALRLNRQVQDDFGQSEPLLGMARIHCALGDLVQARSRLEEALAIVEALRAGVPNQEMRSSYFATTQDLYEAHREVLMRLHAEQPGAGFAAEALHSCERGRARGLLELLAEGGRSIRQGVDPELLERERRLRDSIGSKAERRTRLLNEPVAGAPADLLDEELHNLESEYAEAQAQIRIRSPRYASLTQPRPLNLREIQSQVLDGDTLLLEYALGSARSYLWLVSSEAMKAYELPARSTIEGLAGRVRSLLTLRQERVSGESAKQMHARALQTDAEYRIAAAELSSMLLGPAAGELGGKRLLIVPDGMLHYIPFAALPAPGARSLRASREPDSFRPLIADHEMVFQPSASTMAVLRSEIAVRKRGGNTIAVFADPVFDVEDAVARRKIHLDGGPGARMQAEPRQGLSQDLRLGRLPGTRREAEAVVSVAPSGSAFKLTGFAANRAFATSPKMAECRIIHFATHGIADDEHPQLSAVVLSMFDESGARQDGFLRLLDIYNLNLPAELVVLSACNTLLGKHVKGEGLVGLVRGFMYAGAARVVASLWNVEDQSTARLMESFYRAMFVERRTAAAALRQAQVELWSSKTWSAPYYWAGFVLQGEYR